MLHVRFACNYQRNEHVALPPLMLRNFFRGAAHVGTQQKAVPARTFFMSGLRARIMLPNGKSLGLPAKTT